MKNSGIEFKEISDVNSRELEQALYVYSTVLNPDERRETSRIVDMLKNDKNYHLYAAVDSDSVVGISLIYNFEKLGVGFLDYLAVDATRQSNGIGSNLIKYSMKKMGEQMNDPLGLLFETANPDFEDPSEIPLCRRRLNFYKRNGAKILDGVDYMLPPQNKESELWPVHIMMIPVDAKYGLSKPFVLKMIKSVYSGIYNYDNEQLIKETADKMPSIVKFSDINVTE